MNADGDACMQGCQIREKMGYFDGLVNAALKKTEDGKVAYYPWGVMGKGLVIPDEAHERKLRKFIKAFYMGMFPLIVCAAVFFEPWQMCVVGVVGVGCFYIQSRRLTRGFATAAEAITMRESLANSAQGHGKRSLYALAVSSSLFVLLGVWMVLAAPTTEKRVMGAIAAVLFGACLLVFVKMIRSLRRDK